MTQFKLTNETITTMVWITLFRIKLTKDCKWGKAGDKGGFIEKAANITDDAWVSGDAHVFGNARVSD